MTARLEKLDAADHRRIHRLIAVADQLFVDEVFEFAANDRPFRKPNDQTAADLRIDHEQLVPFPQNAVVALLRLFELNQIRFELFLVEEGGSVKALELDVVGVPFPVGARDRQDLERADPFGRRDMRAAAEIDEFPLTVERDRLLVGKTGLQVIDFERLSHVGEKLNRLGAGHFDPFERLVGLDDLFHLVFDGGEILFRERLVAEKIVVKAGLGRRTERQLDVREEAHHRPRHNVRGRMAENIERFGILFGEETEFDRPLGGKERVGRKGLRHGVPARVEPVGKGYRAGQGRLSEPGADFGGDVDHFYGV